MFGILDVSYNHNYVERQYVLGTEFRFS